MTPTQSLLGYYQRNAQREADARWYAAAKQVTRQRAAAQGIAPDVYAGIVAATSPMQQWTNKAGTEYLNLNAADRVIDWARGLTDSPRTIGANARHGRAILNGADPADVLGPKTRRFWRALLGDDTAVVLDRWALRAIGWPTESITERQWAAAAEPYYQVADQLGITPAGLQSVVWTQSKREANR